MNKKFSDLTATEQTKLAKKFYLPKDETNLFVDKYNRPFERDNGLNMCSMRPESLICGGFHTYANKQ